MSKFLKIVEDCQAGLSSPTEEAGEKAVMQALYMNGMRVSTSSTDGSCFSFTDQEGKRYGVTVKALDVEDEEQLDDEDANKAGTAMKMADKATDDDPQTTQAKRSLGAQVTRTYTDLDRGLRDVTRKLR